MQVARQQHAKLPAGGPFPRSSGQARKSIDHDEYQRDEDRGDTLLPVGDGEIYVGDDSHDVSLHGAEAGELH